MFSCKGLELPDNNPRDGFFRTHQTPIRVIFWHTFQFPIFVDLVHLVLLFSLECAVGEHRALSTLFLGDFSDKQATRANSASTNIMIFFFFFFFFVKLQFKTFNMAEVIFIVHRSEWCVKNQ